MTARERVLAHFDRISEAPDAVPRLRRFVVGLAVRGKLVEQDPSDQPASVLLEQIQIANKTARAKAKQTATVNQNDVLFAAPTGWVWTRIREITSNRGQVIPAEPFTYIDVSSIDNEVGCVARTKVLSADEAPSRARKVVRRGDVLYSCVRPYLLNVAVLDCDLAPPPIASTAFAVLNGHGLVVPKYLWCVLRSDAIVSQVEAKMRGQAYPAINDADFQALVVPLAPLKEQLRIVAKVDELMAVCDRLEAAQKERERRRDRLVSASVTRLNQPAEPLAFHERARFSLEQLPRFISGRRHVKQLQDTILDLAVHGRLVPQREEEKENAATLLAHLETDARAYRIEQGLSPLQTASLPNALPFRAPRGWQWTRLYLLFRAITDGDHLPPPKSDDGVAFLTIGNITTGRLDFTGCRFVPEAYFDRIAPYRKPKRDDFLYTVVGATFGRSVRVDTDRPFCVQRHIAILKPSSGSDLSFLGVLLASPMIYWQAQRSLTGTAQPTIPIRLLRNFLVCVPPLAEQHRIVAKVNELMTVCADLDVHLREGRSAHAALLEATLRDALQEDRHASTSIVEFG